MRAKEALVSPSNALRAGDCTLQTQASNGWFAQDKIQSNKMESSICTADVHSTMAPHLANRSANGKKKSQSHVDPGMHHMCLQLGNCGVDHQEQLRLLAGAVGSKG